MTKRAKWWQKFILDRLGRLTIYSSKRGKNRTRVLRRARNEGNVGPIPFSQFRIRRYTCQTISFMSRDSCFIDGELTRAIAIVILSSEKFKKKK